MRVAEEAGAGRAVEALHDRRVGVGVVAQRSERVLAEVATAAGDGERDDDTVGAGQPRRLWTDLDDFAEELVAEDVAGFHARDEPAVQVQVRAANRRARDPDDRVAWREH